MTVARIGTSTASTVSTRIETITPEIAQRMIDGGAANRSIKERAIRIYSEDMATGLWRLNGEAIKFDEKNALLDGQNRLLACIKAGVSFETVVVRGLPAIAQMSMDSGVKRTLGDALKIKGEKNTNLLGSMLVLHFRWMTGTLNLAGASMPAFGGEAGLAWLDKHPGMRDIASTVYRLSDSPLNCPGSAAGAFLYEASIRDRDALDDFLSGVTTGANLREDDPCLLLRNWLINRSSVPSRRGRPDSQYCLAVLVKAWLAFNAGKSIRNLRWRRMGPAAEPFPMME